jgi:hypothetical protein
MFSSFQRDKLGLTKGYQMSLKRFCNVTGLLFIAIVVLGALAYAQEGTTQAIFTGTVLINGSVPSTGNGTPVIQLLNGQMQFIRDANYEPVGGTYGVSAFSTDGFAEGDRVVFRIIMGTDSIIARTSGSPAIYVGTTLPGAVEPITINLKNNHAPQFTSIPVDTAKATKLYNYPLSATDLDKDPLLFGIVTGPQWLHVDTSTSTLTGTPGIGDVGTSTVVLEVNDGYGGTDHQTFDLTVTPPPPKTQAIFMGTVRINGEIPSTANGIPVIKLLTANMDFVRQANYDPETGMYGVSAFNRDGFNDGDRVVFRIILGTDSLIATTYGDPAIYIGTVLPSPPEPKTVNLFNNRAPGAFSRISPKESAEVNNIIPLLWTRSIDPDAIDNVTYFAFVSIGQKDTTLAILDTTVTFDPSVWHLPVNTLLSVKWTVSASDGHVTTYCSNDTGSFTLTIIGEGVNPSKGIPKTYSLKQNYPNPFNPTTNVDYELAQVSDVKILIYDVLGNVVRVLANSSQPAGSYSMQWDGRNDNGSTVSSGTYIYRMIAVGSNGEQFTISKKMMLIR